MTSDQITGLVINAARKQPSHVLVQIISSKCEALNGPNEIHIGPVTGNWRLTEVDIPNKAAYWVMDIEIKYKELMPKKRTWKERFKEDFWMNTEFTEELKTVYVPEHLFKINQVYDFTKPEPKPRPKPKSNRPSNYDGCSL